MQPHMIGEDTHRRIQHPELHIQKIRVLHTVLRRKHASPLNLSLLHIGQVDGHALSRITLILILPVYLDAADLTLLAHWIHLQRIFLRNGAGYQRPGNDGSESRQGKRPVHRKPWYRLDILRHHLVTGHLLYRTDQTVKPLACRRRYLHHRRVFKECPFQFFPDLFFYQF